MLKPVDEAPTCLPWMSHATSNVPSDPLGPEHFGDLLFPPENCS